MRYIEGKENVLEMCADILQDESYLSGSWCESAAWPDNTVEAAEYISKCAEQGIPLTFSGGLTGISGGALPEGGTVVSTSSMKTLRMLDNCNVSAGAGVTIEELNRFVTRNAEGMFYPPDPTEETASVGGTVATDASGTDSYLYGSTRKWVEGLQMVLPNGRIIVLKRGQTFFDNLNCNCPDLGLLRLPLLSKEQPKKNTAGYYMHPGMDLIDLFIGSEGTLGLITEVELKLAPEPEYLIDLAVFPETDDSFWKVYYSLLNSGEPLRIRALEMMDERCIDFMRLHPGDLPSPPAEAVFVLLLRAEADSDEHLEDTLVKLDEMLTGFNVNPETAWGGFEPSERKRIKDFRHALPEAVNHCISESRAKFPSIHKFGSDGAVDPSLLKQYYELTRSILEDRALPFVIFGHAGQGHIHANAIPENPGQMLLADEAMREIASTAVKMNGTVSAEHGLGKLKLNYLEMMYSVDEIKAMNKMRETISARVT